MTKFELILQAAREGKRLRYKAPMDVAGTTFYAGEDGSAWTYQVRQRGVRFFPSPSKCDPFTADAGHADRIEIL